MGEAKPKVPEAIHWAALTLAVDRVTAEATHSLNEAAIPSILLKGPAIATWLYTSGDRPRFYTDTDLLIQKKDWEKAMEVMRQLGFGDDLGPLAHPRMEAGDGYPWTRTDGPGVDLHYTLFGIGADPDEVWATLSADAVTNSVAGTEVQMPSHPARLLHIALHAVQHGGEVPKPMMDLELALARAPRDGWLDACALADRLGAGDAFTAGLRLLPEGEQLADAIGATHATSPGTALRLNWVPTAEGFKEISEASGLREKLGIVARELFPNRAFMRWWSPLARRGPIGLLLAYCWRPIWLAYRAIPGYLAWRRATRSQ